MHAFDKFILILRPKRKMYAIHFHLNTRELREHELEILA